MVDVEAQLIVHGRDSDVVPQVFGEETAVRHVEVKSVVHVRVDVALQRSAHCLKRRRELKIWGP